MDKKIGILVSTAVVSIWFWFLANDWILSPSKFRDIDSLVFLIIAFSILVSFIALGFLFLDKYPLKVILIFLSVLPIFFVFKFDPLYLLAITILFWIQLYASKNIKDEAEERNKINIRIILRRGVPPIITSLFVVLSFAYFLSPSVQAIVEERTLPPTFRQTIRKVAGTLFENDFQNVPPSERESITEQATEETFRRLNSFIQPFITFVPPLLAFGLFLTLQSLIFFFIWIVVLFGMIIFKILEATGFFTKKEIDVKSEVIEI